MSLLSPWSLAWLGLLAPLVLLYVLKRRRERKVVGSTLLWEAALRDLRAERPWQRLRPHLSLILQALVLIAGAAALARPAGAGSVPAGARIAVVIDASVSMSAREAEGTRLEQAISFAREMSRSLPPGGRMMLIEAGSEPSVLAPLTADRVELERGLDRVRARGVAPDLAGAVALASERMRGAPSGSRIVLVTDEANSGTVPLSASVPVEVRRVGTALANDAIVALDVRARAGETDRADVFVRLARFGPSRSDAWLTASLDGGGSLASRRVSLVAGEPQTVVMTATLPPDARGRGAFVRVELSRQDGSQDPFPLDDVAVAASPAARRLPVFSIGRAPASVERVLASDHDVELFATTLEELERARERDPSAAALDGLLVYAGRTPASAPPGDSVVVAPSVNTIFGVELDAPVATPRIVTWDESDPRLRFVRFGDVHLGDVRPIRGAAARALVTTDAGAVVGALERPDGETTIVAFDPDVGDFATHPDFVVFFRNLLERARARRAEGGIAPGALGEPLRVPAQSAGEVEVRTPDGRTRSGAVRGGVAIVEVPALPGVYRARAGTRELAALRSLLDAEESNLSARASFARSAGGASVQARDAVEPAEAWPWLAGALLLLLALEVLWATRKGAT